ncbi:MAG: protein kinase [Gemmatimonadaceae bacterium]
MSTTHSTDRLSASLADRYRIERELGAGGMATVYLGHDLKHDRKVALKVLRPELSAVIGADRFLLEIKTTANLQHPHILALYDSGQVDGTVFYVMPFVEGESLRDRLEREKQLPVGDAVRIALEIAGALDYAHRHGVIHRDIKPENILLHDGRALVADFGIALAASRTDGSARMTETGMSLGTPHYMSPEQALGERNLDARTDVYALGCVLHEMLAGEPPFSGPNAQAIIARVMSSEPEPVTALRKTVPEHVADAILTALSKLPADRFASAAEFATALGGSAAATTSRSAALRMAREKRSPVAKRALWPAALLVAVAAALWGWLRPRDTVDYPPSRLAILTPQLGDAAAGLQRLLDITADGRTLLYVSGANSESQIMRRSLSDNDATMVYGGNTQFAGVVIAPNAREFIANDAQQTFRFPMDGGSPRALPRELAWSSFAVWASDGTLWMSGQTDRARGIARISASGEVSHPFGPEQSDLTVQQVLPGDRDALVVRNPVGTAFGPPFILDLENGKTTPLLSTNVVEIRYSSGFLVYVLPNGTMEALAYDRGAKRTSGAPVSIATDVSQSGGGHAQFAVSRTGTIVFIPEEPRSLVLIDRSGSSRPAVTERRNFHIPRFSPDGKRLLVDFSSSDGRDVWQVDMADGALTRVTFDRDGHDATWEPDGKFLTYSSAIRAGGVLSIYRTKLGRAQEVDSLISTPSVAYPGVWLPDRSAILTVGNSLASASRSDIALIRNGGRGPVEAIVASRFEEQYPAISADGKWIAYTSDQSGTTEVYARSLAPSGDQVQVSLAGGTEPMWGPSGRELFYRAPASAGVQLWSASMQLSPTLSVTARRRLFDVSDIVTSAPHSNYDVSPDGRTFAMVRQNPATRIMVIQNFPALVKQLERGTARR